MCGSTTYQQMDLSVQIYWTFWYKCYVYMYKELGEKQVGAEVMEEKFFSWSKSKNCSSFYYLYKCI